MTEELESVFGEFPVICPAITNAVAFRLNGEVFASTKGTNTKQIQSLIGAVKSLSYAHCIGGIEKLKIQDVNTQISVTAASESFFAVVALRQTNQKAVNSITDILAPTFIRLALDLRDLRKANLELEVAPEEEKNEEESVDNILDVVQDQTLVPVIEPERPPEPFQSKLPSSQLMVERIGGFLTSQYIVRVEEGMVQKWQETCGDKQFTTVQIETLEGKTISCTIRPVKNLKIGLIQIPEKIMEELECDDGKLVIVRPNIKPENLS